MTIKRLSRILFDFYDEFTTTLWGNVEPDKLRSPTMCNAVGTYISSRQFFQVFSHRGIPLIFSETSHP